MRYTSTYAAVIGLIVFSLAGCQKDDNPVVTQQPYIEAYAAGIQLIDAAGTTYSGDFYPLIAWDLYVYSGDQSVTVTVPGSSTPPASQVYPIMGEFQVLPKQLINLPSGADSLFPIVDMTNAGIDTTRFFKKDTAAVYVKAFRMPDGSFSEVTNPIFIKSNLVVGDSWDAAPRYDLAKALASQNSPGASQINLNMDAKSKFFVIGKETVNLPSIGDKSSIRLEQANDIIITGTVLSEGTTVNVYVSAQFAAIYHFVADTGIVHQNIAGNISISYSYGLTATTIHLTIDKCELLLSSIMHNAGPGLVGSSAEKLESLNTPTEDNLLDLSKEITRFLLKGCIL